MTTTIPKDTDKCIFVPECAISNIEDLLHWARAKWDDNVDLERCKIEIEGIKPDGCICTKNDGNYDIYYKITYKG